MNPRLLEVALRRERLIERISMQRQRLAQDSEAVKRLCAGGDRALATTRYLRENPEWLLTGAVALVVVRPRRAWRLAKSGFFAWRAWAAVRRGWQRFAGR